MGMEVAGGDGVMFYFHGVKGGNYAIVSDDNLQINAHFIGTRPEGLTRNYTWCKLLQSCLTLTVLSLLPRESHIGMIMLMHSLPIRAKEDRIQNYQLPDDDAFAHLETQFRFQNLTLLVEGVLGKTYRPDYVSPVKKRVSMTVMVGEDKYQTPSLYSPLC
ncbi:hypothetical protein Pint_32186 [Pistacia integerrima]|uniref:Uncharacterized protein n=1 Tax=Pistacia integerrima TaxID=434235 RepID=A0ACC0XRP2_9ROSI|nr:hypothetical protein Pint_32186 [Pistacia integerrima]